jgi:uncharacterized protein (TIGR00296 family)
MLTLAEGKIAIRLARDAITSFTENKIKIRPNDLPPVFSENHGVFVTLHKNGELRGCIGYPLPVLPLGFAIVDSAINACSCDPRFQCVKPNELNHIILEVTILTKPEPYHIPKTLLPGTIRIGKDGLIVSKGSRSGLLLPQVAPEWGFDALDFLSHTCLKAGLPPDAWLDEDTEVQHFEAQIFAEIEESSEITEKKYSDSTCEI